MRGSEIPKLVVSFTSRTSCIVLEVKALLVAFTVFTKNSACANRDRGQRNGKNERLFLVCETTLSKMLTNDRKI